jgi:hypothetical protein
MPFKLSPVRKSGGGWAWVRLGKIKCAANCIGLCVGLQLFLFCEGLAFCLSFYCSISVVVLSFRVAPNICIGENIRQYSKYILRIPKFVCITNLCFFRKYSNDNEFFCVRDSSGSPRGLVRSTERSEPTHSPTSECNEGGTPKVFMSPNVYRLRLGLW